MPSQRSDIEARDKVNRDNGAWEEWLAFFLRGVADVSAQAADTARRILALREEHRNVIAQKLGRVAGNGHKVLEHLYRRPIASVHDIAAMWRRTTWPGA